MERSIESMNIIMDMYNNTAVDDREREILSDMLDQREQTFKFYALKYAEARPVG